MGAGAFLDVVLIHAGLRDEHVIIREVPTQSRLYFLREIGLAGADELVSRGGHSLVTLRPGHFGRAVRRLAAMAEGQNGNFDLSVQESNRRPGIDSRSGIDLI